MLNYVLIISLYYSYYFSQLPDKLVWGVAGGGGVGSWTIVILQTRIQLSVNLLKRDDLSQ